MIERISWIVLALIHAVPSAALVFPRMLERLYGVPSGSDPALLLQHRAALFGAMALACLWAIFDPGAARLAVTIVALSMLSFLVLYAFGGYSASLRGIALTDAIGLPFLAVLIWKIWLSG